MTSRTDVAYVGPISGKAMILITDTLAPTAYYCLVVDSNGTFYLSQGAFGDSFYGIYDSSTYKVVYIISSVASDGLNTQIAVYDSINYNNLLGYLNQDSSGVLNVNPSPTPFPLITNDPSNYPTDIPVVLSGVRYQTASPLNVPVVGYSKTYSTGLYGGTSNVISNMDSSSLWFTFVQNSITTSGKCATLNSVTGQIPSSATIAQCYALSGNGYDQLSTCNNMSTLTGFNDPTQCSGPLYYYSTSDCNGSYTFTNFKNTSTQVTSSYGSCDGGSCDFNGSNFYCTSSSTSAMNWIIIISIALIILVIIVVIIVVAVSSSKSKKKTEVEESGQSL